MARLTTEEQLENYADFIWNVADYLRSSFNEDEYGSIVLPFALLRRLEAAMEPYREAVYERYQSAREMGMLVESQYAVMLTKAAKAPFFNTTRLTLATIGATNTLSDMEAYLDGFSANVKEIFEKLNFLNICKQLQDTNLLYITVQRFKAVDLSPALVPARVMSNIYEELIWKFAATKHKQSKEFLTPRDVVRLATTLVLDSDDELLGSDNGLIRTIYDPTCGSCGFITDAMEFIDDYAEQRGAKYPPMLLPFGQDSSPTAWALGKTMMLLRSMQDHESLLQVKQNHGEVTSDVPMDKSVGILRGNTLTDDLHADKEFDFVFSNPPFGMDWGKDYKKIQSEPRFAVGLPPKSDGSMLFLTHVARKLNKTGRGAIVLSGSALFTGDAGSGSSEIRRWLFESDIVETIIQLPGSLFYNTAIQTYLWVLNKKKAQEKKGKILLIDASNFKTLIKNIGTKRYVISKEDAEAISRLVGDFKNTDITRVLDYSELGFREVSVLRPLRLKLEITQDKVSQLSESKAMQKLSFEQREVIKKALTALGTKPVALSAISQTAATLKKQGIKLTKAMQKEIIAIFGVRDLSAELCVDDDGKIIADKELSDTEIVPLGESLDDYMKREVLPFASDACVDPSVRDDRDGKIGKVGYKVSFNKYFYEYVQPRAPEEIATEITALEEQTAAMMKELFK